MNRRRFLKAGLAASLLPAARGEARATVCLADMHFHLFFFGRNPAPSVALAQEVAAGKATLAAWSLASASFADLQRVLGHWERRGISEPRIAKLAIENYARVLKHAMAPA